MRHVCRPMTWRHPHTTEAVRMVCAWCGASYPLERPAAAVRAGLLDDGLRDRYCCDDCARAAIRRERARRKANVAPEERTPGLTAAMLVAATQPLTACVTCGSPLAPDATDARCLACVLHEVARAKIAQVRREARNRVTATSVWAAYEGTARTARTTGWQTAASLAKHDADERAQRLEALASFDDEALEG